MPHGPAQIPGLAFFFTLANLGLRAANQRAIMAKMKDDDCLLVGRDGVDYQG